MSIRSENNKLIKLFIAAFIACGAGLAGYSIYSSSINGGQDEPGEAEQQADFETPAVKYHGTVEESMLKVVEVGTVNGSRFVSLGRPSSTWAFSGTRSPQNIRAALKGNPAILGKDPIKLVFHDALVRGACIQALIEARSFGRIFWQDSTQSKGIINVHAGLNSAKLACYDKDLSGESSQLKLMMFTPGATALQAEKGPVLHGLWIAEAGARLPDGQPGPTPCAGGKGLSMEPGSEFSFTVMATPGSSLELASKGKAAASLAVGYEPDQAGGTESLAVEFNEEKQRAYGSWDIEIDTPTPVRVYVSLPREAEGGLCLDRLSLLHKKPAPKITGSRPPYDGVVFILVDTLRADHLGFINGSSKVKTPRFDALAMQSVLFTGLVASSHYTKPSMGTILTGVYGYEHRALAHDKRLLPSIPLITERMRKAGVDTQGVFSNHFFNNRKFGFQRGWNFRAHINSYTACMGGDPVVEKVRQWAEKWEPKKPYFVYIHVMDPHAPYSPPPAYELEYLGLRITKGRFLPSQTAAFLRKVRRGDEAPPSPTELKILKGLYAADVAHSDTILGKALDVLAEHDILDRSLLIVTSDHGEEFMEHGMLGHGTNVHRELIHVPLLMRWPEGKLTGTVGQTVGHIDLAPTILDAFDIPKPASMKYGRKLDDLIEGKKTNWQKRAYLAEHKNGGTKAVVVGKWELVVGSQSGPKLSYMHIDSEENLDVESHPIAWQYLRRRMADLMAGKIEDDDIASIEVELTEEEFEKLKAIGYILE